MSTPDESSAAEGFSSGLHKLKLKFIPYEVPKFPDTILVVGASNCPDPCLHQVLVVFSRCV